MNRWILATIVALLAIAGGAFAQQPTTPDDEEPDTQAAPELPYMATLPPLRPPAPAPPEVSIPQGPDLTAGTWKLWVDIDYLIDWVKGDHLPPLVTTSPPGTPRNQAGVLGRPNTTIVFGSNNFNQDDRSGFRTDFGYWFTPDRAFGFEMGFMLLDSSKNSFGAASNGNPILARPYISAISNSEVSSLIAFPGVSTGSIQVIDAGHTFFGTNVDFRANFLCSNWYRVDSLFGYRNLHYQEDLTIFENVQPTSAQFRAGTNIQSTDQFFTRNEFNGADLGLRAEFFWEQWTLGLLGKVPVGAVHRAVDIEGSTVTTVPGVPPVSRVGGLFALSSNIGSHSDSDWSVAPEIGLTIGWKMSEHVELKLGYSDLWWVNVAQPGGQIDRRVNPNLIPPPNGAGGPALPAVTGSKNSIWVQGISAVLELRY
jgi:hypothetical protein